MFYLQNNMQIIHCGYWDILGDWQCFRSFFGSVCLWVNCKNWEISQNTDTLSFLFLDFYIIYFKVSCSVVALHQLRVTSTVFKGLQWRFVLNFYQASQRCYWAITNIFCLFLLLSISNDIYCTCTGFFYLMQSYKLLCVPNVFSQ